MSRTACSATSSPWRGYTSRSPASSIFRARIGALPAETHWHTLAKAALRDDLASMLRALAAEALRADGAADPASQIAAWKARNAVLYERVRQVLGELRAAETPDLAMLSVAMRELRNLSSR